MCKLGILITLIDLGVGVGRNETHKEMVKSLAWLVQRMFDELA